MRRGAPLFGELQPTGDPSAGGVGGVVHDLHPIDVLERERLAHQCRYRRGGQATAGVCGMQPISNPPGPIRRMSPQLPTTASAVVMAYDTAA